MGTAAYNYTGQITNMKYYFRGLLILEYNPKTKQVEAPMHEDVNTLANFNHCKFIPEDYANMADFFNRARAHAAGATDVDLTDIEVD